jgi:hypothetical protein
MRAIIALTVVLEFAFVIAASQPLLSPWWIYADADATYVGSSANLMAGEHTFYLDHPGMPLEDLMAMTFETRYLAKKIVTGEGSPHQYAGERLLNLDGERPYFRGFAILFYLFGAALSFFVAFRLLGHWIWGLLGGLLWLGAPGLQTMAIQYRPDVLLAGLVLAVGYLIARAAERRDPWLYVLAALLLGFTITVKMHAAGLLMPFGLALALRPPERGWARRVANAARASLHRFRAPIVAFAGLYLAFAVTFNSVRYPFDTTAEQKSLLLSTGAVFSAYVMAAAAVHALVRVRLLRRIFDPFVALLAVVAALGIAIPGALFLDDGLQMLVKIKQGLLGGGINENVKPFDIDWSQFYLHWPLRLTLILVSLAAIGAIVGLVRHEIQPLIWFSGAIVMGIMASARFGWPHYFAPAFVLSIPAVLWLFRALGTRLGPAAGALLVAVALFTQTGSLFHAARDGALRSERQAAAADRIADELVKPGQVALTDPVSGRPIPDYAYIGLVDGFVSWSPDYPYRFLPDAQSGLEVARERKLKIAYYIGSFPLSVSHEGDVQLASGGIYRVRPLPASSEPDSDMGALQLLSGPGVDRPSYPSESSYDPWTGFFKDAAGHYYDFWGQDVGQPTRRKYVADLGLWLDAFGDFWNAQGKLVMSKPELRTVP